jgi:hypothetical protein
MNDPDLTLETLPPRPDNSPDPTLPATTKLHLNTKRASLYIEAKSGGKCSAATLEKRRGDGSGPPFSRWGKCVTYDPADLDAWIAQRYGARVFSTARYVATLKRPMGRPPRRTYGKPSRKA